MRIFTVGHGARTIDAFLAVLATGPVALVIDVRRYPGSRRHPHFGRESLAAVLEAQGIAYQWVPALGGRRRTGPASAPSPNPAWEDPSFRAYADHMDSDEFAAGLAELLGRAALHPTAVLCAETHPSRCHRRLIADKLSAVGHQVIHLIAPGRAEPHRTPPFLRVLEDGTLRYDVQLPLPGTGDEPGPPGDAR